MSFTLSEREEQLLVWLWECNGLTETEVEEVGEPLDCARLDRLAMWGMVRRSDDGWTRGVYS